MTQVPNHDSCAFHRKHVFSFFPNILRAWGSYSSPKSDTHTVGPLFWKYQKSFPKKSNEAQITLCEFLERKNKNDLRQPVIKPMNCFYKTIKENKMLVTFS